MIPIEPSVTQTIIETGLKIVPIDQIAYIPTDVFMQYQWIQAAIDGGLGLLAGWIGHIMYLKRKAKNEQPTIVTVVHKK